MKKDIMETKKEVLAGLENKSVVEVLAERYTKAEKELLKELSKLKNGGGECNCNDRIRTIIRTIYEGEYPEISTYCLKCGGYTD